MALTNSERQARWRNRLRAAAGADPAQAAETAALRARVAELEAALAKAKAAPTRAVPADGDALATAQARIAALEAALARKTENFNEWLAKIKARKGLVLSKDEFNLVLACLHPDSRAGLSDKRLADAFKLINSRKLVLCRDASAATSR